MSTDYEKAREAAASYLAVREHGGEFQTPEQNWAQMNAYQKEFAFKLVDAALSAFEREGFVLVPKSLDDDTYRDFDDACGHYLNGEGAEVDVANKAWSNLLLALKHKDGQP